MRGQVLCVADIRKRSPAMANRVLFVVICAAIGIVACDKSGPSPAPAPSTVPDQSASGAPAAVAGAPLTAAAAPSGQLEQRVNMQDACDAATFNAAIGDGTCNRQGGMKFEQFIAMLTKSA